MKLQLRHYYRKIDGFYVSSFFRELTSTLEKMYPDIQFEKIANKEYEQLGYGGIYSCMSLSIMNPENQKYILVSFFDNWKYHFMKHLGWEPNNMVQFLYPGGFNYIDYFNWKKEQEHNADIVAPSNIEEIYAPFFYGPYNDLYQEELEEIYLSRSNAETIEKMFFRGWMWDFRKKMLESLNDDSIEFIEKRGAELSYLDYLKDLSKYRAALSLPGGTEVCNRDIECFAVGIPGIRPFLNIEYPVRLIPNYHYISCYGDCKYWSGNPEYLSYQDFAQHVEYYWNIVKNNFEYLDFVAKNARQWYVENCTLENNLKYVMNNLKMEALYG